MAATNVRILGLKSPSQYVQNVVTTAQCDLLPNDQPIDPAVGHWFVARAKDTGLCAGFACLKVCDQPGYGYLARAGVYRDYRGKGLQARLIRVRERKARELGLTHMVSDTHKDNWASANSLIRCGYRMYQPDEPWALDNSIYWIKKL
jgi:GNAT superfamily N-acetyltransferase